MTPPSPPPLRRARAATHARARAELLGPRGQEIFVWSVRELCHPDEICVERAPACVNVGRGTWPGAGDGSERRLVASVAGAHVEAQQLSFYEVRNDVAHKDGLS